MHTSIKSLIVVALALLSASAQATMMFSSESPRDVTYRYVLDEVPGAVMGFSLKRLTLSYNGPAVRLERHSDNVTQDFYFVGNYLNKAAIVSFAAGGDVGVRRWYSQVDGKYVHQPTAAEQPLIVEDGVVKEDEVGNIYCHALDARLASPSDGSGGYYDFYDMIDSSATTSIFSVVNMTSNNTSVPNNIFCAPYDSSSTYRLFLRGINDSSKMGLNVGTDATLATFNNFRTDFYDNWHTVTAIAASGTKTLNYDYDSGGSSTSGVDIADIADCRIILGNVDPFNNDDGCNLRYQSLVVYPSDQTNNREKITSLLRSPEQLPALGEIGPVFGVALKKLNANYFGPLARVQNINTSLASDIGLANGKFDKQSVDSLIGPTEDISNLRVTNIYDQFGNGDGHAQGGVGVRLIHTDGNYKLRIVDNYLTGQIPVNGNEHTFFAGIQDIAGSRQNVETYFLYGRASEGDTTWDSNRMVIMNQQDKRSILATGSYDNVDGWDKTSLLSTDKVDDVVAYYNYSIPLTQIDIDGHVYPTSSAARSGALAGSWYRIGCGGAWNLSIGSREQTSGYIDYIVVYEGDMRPEKETITAVLSKEDFFPVGHPKSYVVNEFDNVRIAVGTRLLNRDYEGYCMYVYSPTLDDWAYIPFDDSGNVDRQALLDISGGGLVGVIDLFDQSGNGYDFHATSGNEPFVVDSNGNLLLDSHGNVALHFDGGNDFLTNATWGGLTSATDKFTLVAEFAGFSSSTRGADVWGFGPETATELYALQYSANLKYWHTSGTDAESVSSGRVNTHVVIGTSNGTNYEGNVKMFVDGIAEKGAVAGSSLAYAATSFYLGRRSTVNYSDHFYGSFTAGVFMDGDMATQAPYVTAVMNGDPYTPSPLAEAWVLYGLARMNPNYDGPAIQVQRVADDAQQDIGFVGDKLDIASLLEFAGTDTLLVSRIYNQGIRDAELYQGTKSAMPTIVSSGSLVVTNTDEPAMLFDGVDDVMISDATVQSNGHTSAALLSIAEPASDYTSSSYNSLFGFDNIDDWGVLIIAPLADIARIRFATGEANTDVTYTRTAPVGSSEIIIGDKNDLTVSVNVNGALRASSTFTVNPTANNNNTLILGRPFDDGGEFYDGKVQAVGYWLNSQQANVEELTIKLHELFF